jgi:PAS domain S-box-containing protein
MSSIKSKLLLGMFLIGTIILARLFTIVITSAQVEHAGEISVAANEITRLVLEINAAAYELLMSDSTDATEESRAATAALTDTLSGMSRAKMDAVERDTFRKFDDNYGVVISLFTRLSDAIAVVKDEHDPEARERAIAAVGLLRSHMLLRLAIMADDATTLAKLNRTSLLRAVHSSDWMAFGTLGFLLMAFAALAIFVFKRLIRSLSTIQSGAAIVGAGNLAHRIKVGGNDEIARVATTFNRMTERLQHTYRNLDDVNEALQRELTERRQIQETLQRQSATLKLVLDCIVDAVVVADREAKVILCNPAAERIFGSTLVGSTADERAAMINVLPRDAHAALRADELPLSRAVRGDHVDSEEVLIQRAGQHPKNWANVAGGPLRDEEGHAHGGVIVLRDITERKLAEEKFRGLLEAAPDAIVIVEENGRIVLINVQAERMFGYARAELIGQPVETLIPERTRLQHRGNRAEYFKDLRSRPMGAGLELFCRRKDGTEVPVEISLSPLRTDQGILVSSAIRDISERRRAEATIDRYMRDLERSNKELDEFAYIASHDLKEPLRGIHNYAMFLVEDYGDTLEDQARGHMANIQRLTKRLSLLIDKLLHYSRLGSTPLVLDEVDLDAVVDGIVAELRPVLPEGGVEIRRARRLPTVRCDAIWVRELLQNLIVNGAKYNDKPRPLVEVGYLDGARAPTLFVRDNGIGIPTQHQDKIFRIFKRLHDRNQFGGGSGAGLTIVNKIVERHGGRIWLESCVGEGTTFYFTLSGETPAVSSHRSGPAVVAASVG